MAGPYGITQVDVPGILGAYQNAQQARMQQMHMQRQETRAAAEDERRIKREGIVSRIFSPQSKGGDPASGGTAPAQVGATQAGPPGQLVDPAQLPPRTDGLALNPDALRELYAVDPDTAKQVQDMVYTANKQQFEAMQRNGEAMATVAWRLKQMPQEDRAAEVQAWAPQLQQMGLTPEMLARADLSDAGLERYYIAGRKLSEVAAERKPKFTGIPYGSDIVDLNNPDAVAAYQRGQPQGNDASAPPAAPKSRAEFDALPPGTQFMDPQGQIRVKGGSTQPASGGFPGR
jgi:hypothetical protein